MRPTVYCIQIDDESFEIVKTTAGPDLDVHRATLSDLDILTRVRQTAHLIFCGWDGQAGRAHQFISHLIKDPDRSSPPLVFPVILPGTSFPPLPEKKLKVNGWLTFPKDLVRLTAILFKIRPEDVEDSATAAESPDEKAASRQKIQDIRQPASISDFELIEKITQAWKALDQREAERALTKPKSDLHDRSLVLFHAETSGVSTLGRRIRELGYRNVESCSVPCDVYHLLRSAPVHALVLWYQEDMDATSKVLREVAEMRDIDRVATLVICPGESAVKVFAKESRDLFFDRIAIPGVSPQNLDNAIAGAFTAAATATTPLSQVFRMRRPWRVGSADYDRTPMPRGELDEILGKIAAPGDYWVKAEAVLHLLLSGDAAAALKHAEILLQNHPNFFDAHYILSAAKAKNGNVEAAAADLLEQALTRFSLNEEKCFRLSRMFFRWKAFQAYSDLMCAWQEREDLRTDHQFYFQLSQYHRGLGDRPKERAFLFHAVMAAPQRADYLAALGAYYESVQSYQHAATVWRFALRSNRCERILASLGLIRCLISCKIFNEATSLIEALIEEFPNNREISALKAKLVAAKPRFD